MLTEPLNSPGIYYYLELSKLTQTLTFLPNFIEWYKYDIFFAYCGAFVRMGVICVLIVTEEIPLHWRRQAPCSSVRLVNIIQCERKVTVFLPSYSELERKYTLRMIDWGLIEDMHPLTPVGWLTHARLNLLSCKVWSYFVHNFFYLVPSLTD